LTETISHYETDEDGFKGEFKGMRIEIMRFTADFDELVNSSDLVVSHAGTSVLIYLKTNEDAEYQARAQS
jgi:UDP-N-acetylglucosamine transferase subunit ALG13